MPKEWPPDTFNRFPKDLLIEILEEVPDCDKDLEKYINSWVLESDTPVFARNSELLKTNLYYLEMTPQYILDLINKRWNLNVKTKGVYDPNPDRSLIYAKMNKDTARPSVMINGQIDWGISRWIASLLRGDDGIWVWKIKAD